MEKKSVGKIIGFLLLIIGLGLVGYGAFLGYKEGAFSPNKPNNDSNNNVVLSFNGVYENGTTVIKLFQINNSLSFNISDNNFNVSSRARISGDTATDELFENSYTFKVLQDGLQFTTNSTDVISGSYKKTKDYDIKKYYEDNYGNDTYINSKYNGEYNFNDIKAYMYQKDEKTVRLYLFKGFSSIDIEYEIRSDGTLIGKIFDDEYEVTLSGDSFVFKVINGDEKEFEGTYSLVKNLSMDDIINNFN